MVYLYAEEDKSSFNFGLKNFIEISGFKGHDSYDELILSIRDEQGVLLASINHFFRAL